MNDAAKHGPIVSGNQVMSAGLAAAAAAFVTSRFGVAGTLIGAALTAMIITGGSAVLKAYLESVTGSFRDLPGRVRSRSDRRKAERYAEPGPLPVRPDLRDNVAGRMRAALGWFSRLPPLTRRSILVKGLVAAAVAFIIGMGAVYGVEKVIGNSLSCGLWAECPVGAAPGIHLIDRQTNPGAKSTLVGGRAKTTTPANGGQAPLYQQGAGQQNPSYQGQNLNQQEGGGYQQPSPADSGVDQQNPGFLAPDEPAQPEVPPAQSPAPSSASPAPAQPGQEFGPSSASPAPGG